jgi:hypothetical protein
MRYTLRNSKGRFVNEQAYFKEIEAGMKDGEVLMTIQAPNGDKMTLNRHVYADYAAQCEAVRAFMVQHVSR